MRCGPQPLQQHLIFSVLRRSRRVPDLTELCQSRQDCGCGQIYAIGIARFGRSPPRTPGRGPLVYLRTHSPHARAHDFQPIACAHPCISQPLHSRRRTGSRFTARAFFLVCMRVRWMRRQLRTRWCWRWCRRGLRVRVHVVFSSHMQSYIQFYSIRSFTAHWIISISSDLG